MFSKPRYGWTHITIGKFTDRASHLTDIPMNTLDACIFGVKNNSPIAISFDAEGYEYIVIIDYYNTHIICDKDTFELISISINRECLLKQIIEDFYIYFNEWSNWNPEFRDMEDNEGIERIKEHEIKFRFKLEELKRLL